MNEVDFSGWHRTQETMNLIKDNPKYRLSINWQRFLKAIKYKRWHYFNWWNIKRLIFNEIKQF